MYIYRPVHYLLCFVCFLDVVLLVTCRKFTNQTNYVQEWVEWYRTTVSGFTSELFYSRKILVVHCKWKTFDICCALCILRLIISFVPVSRQNFSSQTKKYRSNGCTVDFNIYIRKDAARGISKFGLGHDVKVRLICLYFNQCSLNMCNYHISDLLFSNQFLWRCCPYNEERFQLIFASLLYIIWVSLNSQFKFWWYFMLINVSLKAFNEVVSFFLERKHACQESLFTAVSIEV